MRTTWTRRDWLKTLGAAAAVGSSGLLAACGDDGADDEPIASNLLETTPENQAATYRHVDRLGPTRVIRRGTSVLPLPAHGTSLAAMRYDFGPGSYSIDDYMSRNRTAGLLILKGGAVALERYGMGNNAASRWTSFSVAKSVTSTLVGAALKDGSIRSLDDGVALYVPQLAGSAYEQNSIRDLLRMSSGVRWIEEYSTTGDSDIARLVQASDSGQPGAMLELMRTRPRAAAPGSVFNYSTGESYVLGAIVAAATGQRLSDYLSQKVWAPLGMEADGYWLLDAPNGLEMGGNNFSATLRDFARFGQFFLREGMVNGNRVLPDGWRDLAGQPDAAVTAHGQLYPGYPLGYGYQWWSFPTGASAIPFHDGAFTAEGIFGQFIYVNPAEDMVAVVWSAWPESWVDMAEFETYTLLGTAAAMLR
jgi:CubicO group peptidase (beta-lactamase class C family)